MIWEKLCEISTDYVLGGSRYEPYNTDCSGMVCAGFYQYMQIDPILLGWWTGGIWQSDILDTIWSGDTPELPYYDMKPDDFIFTSTKSPIFDTVNGSHVGLYTGNPDSPFLSHFANGGPYITPVNGVYSGCEQFFGVRRLKDSMSNVWDDTSYQEPFATGATMGTRLVYIDKYVNEIRDNVLEMPSKLWEYNYEGTSPFGNMYNCAVQTNLFAQDIKRDLERLEEKVEQLARIIEQLPKE